MEDSLFEPVVTMDCTETSGCQNQHEISAEDIAALKERISQGVELINKIVKDSGRMKLIFEQVLEKVSQIEPLQKDPAEEDSFNCNSSVSKVAAAALNSQNKQQELCDGGDVLTSNAEGNETLSPVVLTKVDSLQKLPEAAAVSTHSQVNIRDMVDEMQIINRKHNKIVDLTGYYVKMKRKNKTGTVKLSVSGQRTDQRRKLRNQRPCKIGDEVVLRDVGLLTGDRTTVNLMDFDEADVRIFWKDWSKPKPNSASTSTAVSTQNRLMGPHPKIIQWGEQSEEELRRKENIERVSKTALSLRTKLKKTLHNWSGGLELAETGKNSDDDDDDDDGIQRKMDQTDNELVGNPALSQYDAVSEPMSDTKKEINNLDNPTEPVPVNPTTSETTQPHELENSEVESAIWSSDSSE